VELTLISSLFCLLGRRSVYTVLTFDRMYIANVWLSLGLLARGYGLEGPSRAALLKILADLSSLVHVYWVSFGAWLLDQINNESIWLAKYLLLLRIKNESKQEPG